MRYRPEVDGLRAVAIIPVILFHAGFLGFSGGFVGVDVFFVISGYLITSLILEEMDRGRFSFLDFYERRIRRIAPTLGIVLVACIPFAWLWMLPDELAEFGKTLASTSVFLSNFTFWGESGYFDSAAELKPLLHTWSLSVEEQFYVFFPVTLLWLSRINRRRLPWMLAAGVVAGFLLADWASTAHPTAAYFFIVTRAWQLLTGALLAALPTLTDRFMKGGWGAESMGLAGAAMIAVAVATFDKTTPFPGRYALLPTMGAALIILAAGPLTWIGRLLSLKPVVFIGVLSYAMYMWHQPVFAFARLRSVEGPGAGLMLTLCVVVVVLAWLTRRYIEMPLRRPKAVAQAFDPRSTYPAYRVFVMGTLLVFGVGALLHGQSQMAHRKLLPDSMIASLERPQMPANCFDTDDIHRNDTWFCRLGKAQSADDFFLLGDSHAYSLHKSFEHVASLHGLSGLFAGLSGCPPLLGVHSLRSDQQRRNCHALNERVFEYVKSQGIKKVVLVGRWTYYTDGGYEGNDFNYLGLTADSASTLNLSRKAFEHGVAQTVERYRGVGVEVYFVQQVPQQLQNARLVYNRAAVARQLTAEHLNKVSVPLEVHHKLQAYANDVLERSSGRSHLVSFDAELCDADRCSIGTPDASRYFDDDHVSMYGASLLEPAIGEMLQDRARNMSQRGER